MASAVPVPTATALPDVSETLNKVIYLVCKPPVYLPEKCAWARANFEEKWKAIVRIPCIVKRENISDFSQKRKEKNCRAVCGAAVLTGKVVRNPLTNVAKDLGHSS